MSDPRIVLYSHDAMGIGHLRRNLLIAAALAGPEARGSVLLVAGVSEATCFKLPPRVDLLTLPALRKEANGYECRRLDMPPAALIALRAQTIRAAVTSFAPDVLVVDKLPRGVAGELEPTLRALRRSGKTRCVLGLRDVLDDPQIVRAEWARHRYTQALQRHYDAVWVYGDPTVYDTVREYSFSPALAAKTRYTGYLERPAVAGAAANGTAGEPDPVRALGLPAGRRLALCMVGGGEDGAAVAQAFLAAKLPDDMVAVLLTGPFMPEEVKRTLMRRAGRGTRRRVLEFVPETSALLRRAERVITMGGYNSVCEVLFARKCALVVPRVRPRLEQWIRAHRLNELGLIDVLHPDAVSAEAMTRWLRAPQREPEVYAGGGVAMNFGGLARLPGLLAELLAPAAPGIDSAAKGNASAARPAPRAPWSAPRVPLTLRTATVEHPHREAFIHVNP